MKRIAAGVLALTLVLGGTAAFAQNVVVEEPGVCPTQIEASVSLQVFGGRLSFVKTGFHFCRTGSNDAESGNRPSGWLLPAVAGVVILCALLCDGKESAPPLTSSQA